MSKALDPIKSYEALFRIERELRYPLTRDEVEQRGRDAMSQSCKSRAIPYGLTLQTYRPAGQATFGNVGK